MLDFVLPAEKDRDSVLDFYDEIEKSGGECIGFKDHSNFDIWLKDKTNRHMGKDLPEGFVRENFYLCYESGVLVGVFSLKFELTDFLRDYGGHIGYAVRPSLCRKGYATQMLSQGLHIAKSFGFERVLCVCDEDNIPSEKTIVKNGGVLENTLFDPFDKTVVKRYWIALGLPNK